ncbi:MAG TPA: DUF3347 domain-containing protein [Puia sp.]|nr:DUF3347 domain-containing protein [Puia sp.]
MKRLVLIILIAVIAFIAVWKLLVNKSDITQNLPKDKPLLVGKNTDSFTRAFSVMLDSYFALKDALVEWDITKADQEAMNLKKNADSLPVNQIKGDSSIMLNAQNLAGSISAEVKGFEGEKNIDQKRRAFNMLTEELYNLVRNVRYDGEPIYHDRCPMAFNETEEGYWLSNSRKIVNPYLGKKHPKYNDKMVGCGEVVDSLDFSKK